MTTINFERLIKDIKYELPGLNDSYIRYNLKITSFIGFPGVSERGSFISCEIDSYKFDIKDFMTLHQVISISKK